MNQPGNRGSLVSSHFTFTEGADRPELREALAVIDSLHTDGPIRPVTIEVRLMSRRLDGFFNPFDGRITISSNVSGSGFALIHEVGHVIDYAISGWADTFALAQMPDLDGWKQAVANSDCARALYQFAMQTDSVEQKIKVFKYSLSARELWARSYAQWVVLRSGHPRLRTQLQEARTDTRRISDQWTDKDFEPIAAAIDDLFRMWEWKR